MLLYVITSCVMLCQKMSHYVCDVVPSYVILMAYYVILCWSASGRTETNRQGRTNDLPLRFFEPCKLASISVFEAHHASIVFANGGGLRPAQPPPPPPPPRFFEPCEVASKYMVLFETHRASIVFANMGGGGAAPPPPAVLNRASLLQST